PMQASPGSISMGWNRIVYGMCGLIHPILRPLLLRLSWILTILDCRVYGSAETVAIPGAPRWRLPTGQIAKTDRNLRMAAGLVSVLFRTSSSERIVGWQ